MKAKLFLFIIVIFSISCSEKYSESENVATSSYEKSEMSMDTVMSDFEMPANEQVMDLKSSKVSNERTRTGSKSILQQKRPEYLSDTLYLSNVRLSKKLIFTADLRFKVKNVEKSTNTIEKLVLQLGGYIHQSHIRSNYQSGRTIEFSSDTVMEITEYYIENNMVLRVPNIYFDSVLTAIGNLHLYLDRREVKTEDVSTTFLKNKLKHEKRTEYEKRIQKAVDKAPRKLDDIVMAERTASDLADLAIDKKIENYQLQDRIDFSTIVINMYQANTIRKELTENTRLTQYQPDFWQRAWKALKTGWKAILEIIIGLLYIWPLYILAVAIYFIIRYFRNKWRK